MRIPETFNFVVDEICGIWKRYDSLIDIRTYKR